VGPLEEARVANRTSDLDNVTVARLLIGWLLLVAAGDRLRTPTCSSVDDCLATLDHADRGDPRGSGPRTRAVADQLWNLEPAASKTLAARLDDERPRISSAAGLALSQLFKSGGVGTRLFANTLRAAAHPDRAHICAPFVASRAEHDGCQSGDPVLQDPWPNVEPLAELIRDPAASPRGRIRACEVVATLGHNGLNAAPALRSAYLGSDAAVTDAARRALSRIGEESDDDGVTLASLRDTDPPGVVRDRLPELLRRTPRAPWKFRIMYLQALHDRADERALPILRNALKSPAWQEVILAAKTMARVGPASRAALPDLRRTSTSHWHPEVRAQVALVVELFERKARPPATFFDQIVPPTADCLPEDPALSSWVSMDQAREQASWATASETLGGGTLTPEATGGGDEDQRLVWITSQRRQLVMPSREVAVVTTGSRIWLFDGAPSPWIGSLEKARDGSVVTNLVLTLPGVPTAYRRIAGDRIIVTSPKGTVTVRADGTVEAFSCRWK
jgi:HEAT repeat protein